MTAQPGTREYARQLSADIAAARQAAGVTGSLSLGSPFEAVAREIAYADSAAAHLLNQRAEAHNAAVRAARQARINAHEAQRIRDAVCGTCYTEHAGECW